AVRTYSGVLTRLPKSRPMSDAMTLAGTLPTEIARKIGAAPQLAGDDGPLPETNLDWALHWASRGLRLFPTERFLGIPLVARWYASASCETAQIVAWWSEWRDADIGAAPELSGHFALAVVGDDGLESLNALEEKHGELIPDFTTETLWNTKHLWF